MTASKLQGKCSGDSADQRVCDEEHRQIRYILGGLVWDQLRKQVRPRQEDVLLRVRKQGAS